MERSGGEGDDVREPGHLHRGARLSTRVPSPTWPYALSPHAHTVPSERSASPWSRPPATPTTDVSVPTRTGVVRVVVVPSPISPSLLSPHAHKVPSERIA